MQAGILRQIERKWKINLKITGTKCVETDGQSNVVEPIGKEEVVSLLTLMGIGFVTSVLLLCFELLLRKTSSHKVAEKRRNKERRSRAWES